MIYSTSHKHIGHTDSLLLAREAFRQIVATCCIQVAQAGLLCTGVSDTAQCPLFYVRSRYVLELHPHLCCV